MKKDISNIIGALMVAALSSVSALAAGTDTWQGNTDVNWTTAGNWITSGGSTPPASGDSLVFGAAGSSGLSLNNNISGLSVNKLTFNSGASSFTVGGNGLTLGSGGIDASALTSGTMTFTPTITIGNGFQRWNVGSGATLAFGRLGSGADAQDLYNPNGAIAIISNTGTKTTTTADGWGWRGGVGGGTGPLGPGMVIDNGNNTYDWASVGNQTPGTSLPIVAATYTTAPNASDSHNVKVTSSTAVTENNAWASLLVSNATLTVSGTALYLDTGMILENGGTVAGSAPIKSDNTDGLYIYVPDTGTISSSIQNNGVKKLYKSGPGTLTLSGANSYTGNTVIYEGALNFNYGSGANVTFGSGISGVGPVTLTASSGTPRVHFNAANTYSGATTIGAGVTLEVNASAAYSANSDYTVNGGLESYNNISTVTIGALNGSGTIYNTGDAAGTTTFTVGANGHSGSFSGAIVNGAWGSRVTALVKSGAGTQTLTGNNTYSGSTTLNAGTLALGNPAALGTGTLTISGGNLDSVVANLTIANNSAQNWNSDFTFVGSQSLNLGSGAVTLNATRQVTVSANTLTVGGITDSGAGYGLTKTGNGTLKLNGANSYTGTTAVNGGVLLVANTTQGNGPVTVSDGAAAGVAATADTTYWMPGSLTVGSSTGGALQFGVFGTTQPAMAPSSLTLNGTTTINISSAPFVNNVSYPLFSGYTSGTLVLGSQPNGLLGHLVIGGGTVSYAVTNVAVTTWTAAVSTNWDTTTANWTNSVGGNHFAANNPVQLNDSANGAGPLLVNITPAAVAPATIVVSNTAKSYVIGGLAISGTTGLTKTGNNTLTLTGTNTFAGDIAISGGTVEIGGAGQLGSGNYLANIQDDATLKVNTTAAQTLSGTISGNGALVKTNTGTLTLSGANTFIGGVTNNAGTLLVGNSAGLGTGDLTLNTGTLQNAANIGIYNNIVSGGGGTISIPVSANQDVYYGGSLSGTGPLTIGGGGPIKSLNLGFVANTLTGTITIPASPNQTVVRFKTPTAGSPTAAWDITGDNSVRFVTLDFDGTIDFGSLTGPGILAGNGGNQKIVSIGALGTSTTFSGSLRNGSATEVALTKVGAGVLTLTGGNTYTGLTTVQNGSLVAGAAGAFGANASPIALGDATTIGGNLSPSLIIAGAYSMTHDVTVGYDATATTGIYTMGGNTASSVTLNGSISLNQNLVVTQATGGLLTISGTLGGSGGLTKTGNGAVNLAGGYSYAGPTVVNAGTLSLNAAQSSSSSSTLTVNNATLALTLNDGNSSISSADVVFTGNSVLNLNFGAATTPAAAAINANGFTVSNTGTNTINITGPGLVVGQYPLIYTSGPVPTNNFVLGSLPLGVAAVLTNSGTSLDLLITGTGQTLAWYGADSLGNPLTTWNINTSSNWNSGNAKYLQYSGNSYGDYVMFDDSLYTPSGADITLNIAVVPASVTFNNSSTAYSVTGSGGIGGAIALVKSGSGSLYLGTSNSYTGGTIVNGGILSVAKDSALGASNGPVTLNGVTLQYSNTTASVRSITMTANSTLDVALGANAQLAGVVSGGASLTKTGNGALTLSGTNTYTGKTIVDGGTLGVTGGQVPSPSAAGPGLVVGSTQNAALSISGGNVAANTSDGEFAAGLLAGNASGIVGSVAVSGSGNLASSRQIVLGNASGSYGAWNQSGGTASTGTNVGGFLVVAASSASAVFEQSGGAFTIGYNAGTIAAGNSGSLGVMNLSGGTFTSMATSGSYSTAGGLAVGENGTGVLNVSGGASLNLSGNFNLLLGRNTGASGIVNLLGGTLATTQVSPGSGSSIFNFNGGTLLAGAASATFMGGLTSAHVYSGGAVINSSSNAITIDQPLLAPTDHGVSSISLSSGGTGYMAPPVVTISGGTGSGATAIAQVSGGAVTTVVVTSPGTGYQSGDVLSVNFTGGGGSGATANTPALALNTSGGLTKTGTGTLTLSGANTYTGNTTIKGGTLELAQSVATLATNSTVSITNGAFLQLTAGTVTNVVAGLVTNGVTVGNGLYSSANSSGYITGSGYLKVGTSAPAPTAEPINFGYNASSGQLTLSWTQSGWRLERQTNNLTTGLSLTGWTDVSGASSPYIITVDPAKPTVFYRLVNP